MSGKIKSHLNKRKEKNVNRRPQKRPFSVQPEVFVAEHLVAVGRRAPRCGGVLQQRCQYPRDEEALDMHAKSLDIKARILGGDGHPDVAASHVNTGNTLIRMEKHEGACSASEGSKGVPGRVRPGTPARSREQV